MNKTKISKIIISILTFLLIVCLSTNVFADPIDLGDSLGQGADDPTGEGAGDNNDDETQNFDKDFANQNQTTDTDKTPENSETAEPEADKKPENDIPYAGPVEDALMITAFISFAIMGIYTFIKLSDYSNI